MKKEKGHWGNDLSNATVNEIPSAKFKRDSEGYYGTSAEGEGIYFYSY